MKFMAKNAVVIGAGIAGLAMAIRLALKNYTVTVIEKIHVLVEKFRKLNPMGSDSIPVLRFLPCLTI